MALFWRIWAAVTIINLAVLTVFVGLATLRFGSINSGLAGERLLVLAERTAAPFESAARIGLPLSTVRNATALIEQARQTDDAILAIHVFDATGQVVHSTASPAPAAVPPVAATARADSNGAPWHRETADGLLSSIDIAARGGGSAGGILISYSSGDIATRIWAMAAELALDALVVLFATTALSGLVLYAVMRRQIRNFEDIERTISGFERRSWRAEAGGLPIVEKEGGRGPAPEDLQALLEAAENRYQAVGRAIAGIRGGGS